MTQLRRIAATTAALCMLSSLCAGTAYGQQLDVRFSCSAAGDDGGDPVTYADNGEVHIDGTRIDAFQWESSLFRRTHGFDCSIDDGDGLQAEAIGDGKNAWRISVVDPADARARRGYDYATRMNCTIRLLRNGDELQIKPSCPALCGSRMNFSELSVNLKSGACRYEQ